MALAAIFEYQPGTVFSAFGMVSKRVMTASMYRSTPRQGQRSIAVMVLRNAVAQIQVPCEAPLQFDEDLHLE